MGDEAGCRNVAAGEHRAGQAGHERSSSLGVEPPPHCSAVVGQAGDLPTGLLFSDLLRHAAWAAVLGSVSGLACAAARFTFRFLQWCFIHHGGLLPDAAASLPAWLRVLIPVAGALCAWGILKVRDRWAHPPPFSDYVESVRRGGGVMPFAATLWRTLSSAFSIATGAAVGREGSMIQFATASASACGSRVSMPGFPLPRQVACGAAAAVAAAYQAPIAGVFFASEIVLGLCWELPWNASPSGTTRQRWDTAAAIDYLLLAVSSTAGWLVSRQLLAHGPLFPGPGPHVSAFSLEHFPSEWWWLLPLAALLGTLGPAYQWLIGSVKRARKWPLALVWGGLAVGLLSLVQVDVWGNGDEALLRLTHTSSASPAPHQVLLVLAARLVATTLCVGVGTIGGVFTPTLFVGASAGLLLAYLAHLTAPLLAVVVGLSSLLASVTHAPLMATFMTVELTGRWDLFPLVFVANLLAWQIAVHLSPQSLYAIASTSPGDRRPDKQA